MGNRKKIPQGGNGGEQGNSEVGSSVSKPLGECSVCTRVVFENDEYQYGVGKYTHLKCLDRGARSDVKTIASILGTCTFCGKTVHEEDEHRYRLGRYYHRKCMDAFDKGQEREEDEDQRDICYRCHTMIYGIPTMVGDKQYHLHCARGIDDSQDLDENEKEEVTYSVTVTRTARTGTEIQADTIIIAQGLYGIEAILNLLQVYEENS